MEDRKGTFRETAVSYPARDNLMTYDDYLRAPAGIRYQLLEGELSMTPSPTTRHQMVVNRLNRMLLEQLEDAGLGRVFIAPLDVVLSEHNVLQPDILFILKDRLGIVGEAFINGAPDLVIEVLSPSTEAWDRISKRRVYSQYGVNEYWIVDPSARTVEISARVTGYLSLPEIYRSGDSIASPLFPRLQLDMNLLFAD